MITRYKPVYIFFDGERNDIAPMHPDSDGEYVLYTDYEKLEAEVIHQRIQREDNAYENEQLQAKLDKAISCLELAKVCFQLNFMGNLSTTRSDYEHITKTLEEITKESKG